MERSMSCSAFRSPPRAATLCELFRPIIKLVARPRRDIIPHLLESKQKRGEGDVRADLDDRALADAMCSLEVFVPRSSAGLPALHERLACLAKAEPSFLSISGIGGGALSLASQRYKELGVKAELQLDTSRSKSAVEECLKQAIAAGISNVLLLPAPSPSSTNGFATVLEMVEFVVATFGKDALTIAVCGYARGTRGEHGHFKGRGGDERSDQGRRDDRPHHAGLGRQPSGAVPDGLPGANGRQPQQARDDTAGGDAAPRAAEPRRV